jgi:hypothetical protein
VSDKPSSAVQWFRDSSLQIISALVGSSLLVTIITTVYSEINQPNVYLSVIPHISLDATDDIRNPRVDYYETIVKNNGKRQATNLTLSMYFYGSMTRADSFFASETLEDPKVEQLAMTPKDMSLLRWDIPRLAPGALMIFYISTDNANKFDSYYITAAFDEGSKTFPEFSVHDIQSERFPNILAGRDDSQTIQLLLILFVVLCAISFTIAVTHKSIKDIIKKRRQRRKWNEIEFNLFLAVPITILSSIFILYVCEEIPRSIVLQSLIIPPLDATEGAAIDTPITIRNITYSQGDLLLGAGIFWSISFLARSLLSYFIAKIIIKKLYPDKQFPNRFLAASCVFIMGEPIGSSIILFFNKSTYNIEPVYLFFLFLVLDIIRMLILVLLVPKIFLKNNNLLYYGLIAISLVAGLLHLLLFSMLLKLDMTNELKPPFQSPFLQYFMVICLIAGLLQLAQIILIRSKEKSKSVTLPRSLAAASISAGLIVLWIWLVYYVTSGPKPDPMLFTGIPIILIGIVAIVLDTLYIGVMRLIRIRKVYKSSLKLAPLETGAHNGVNSSSEPCFALSERIRVKGKLEFNGSNKKLDGKHTITMDNGEHGGYDNSTFNAITDEEGNFESLVTVPSHVGSFKMQAHFEGSSHWDNKTLFTIEVISPADSEGLTYNTRLRNVSLSVRTGIVDRDGQFFPKNEFKVRELITFVVSLFDIDTNTPVREETNISLMLYGVDNQKTPNPLPPTDSEGKTYASILAPPIASNGWIFWAHYAGNSIYSKTRSPLGSYSTTAVLVP